MIRNFNADFTKIKIIIDGSLSRKIRFVKPATVVLIEPRKVKIVKRPKKPYKGGKYDKC